MYLNLSIKLGKEVSSTDLFCILYLYAKKRNLHLIFQEFNHLRNLHLISQKFNHCNYVSWTIALQRNLFPPQEMGAHDTTTRN